MHELSRSKRFHSRAPQEIGSDAPRGACLCSTTKVIARATTSQINQFYRPLGRTSFAIAEFLHYARCRPHSIQTANVPMKALRRLDSFQVLPRWLPL